MQRKKKKKLKKKKTGSGRGAALVASGRASRRAPQPLAPPAPPRLAPPAPQAPPRLPARPRRRLAGPAARPPAAWRWHAPPLAPALSAGGLRRTEKAEEADGAGGCSKGGAADRWCQCSAAPSPPPARASAGRRRWWCS